MKLLLDAMYRPSLAEALRAANVDAATAAELGLAGRSDLDVFATAADHLTSGQHHPGVLIALSPRCSRRPAGRGALVAAVLAAAAEPLEDRVSSRHGPAGDERRPPTLTTHGAGCG